MEYSNNKNELEADEEDVFDKLPDHLLDLIFNKIHDAKSLCNSLPVSKRFHSLLPSQIHSVSLTLPPPRRLRRLNSLSLRLHANSDDGDPTKPIVTARTTSPKHNFLLINRVLNKLLFNPIKSLVIRIAAIRKSSRSHCECEDHDDEEEENTFDLVSQALKSFNSIKSLHIQLPGHNRDEMMMRPNLLKWKAEFGEKFESCVILGATSSSFFHAPVPQIINELEKESASASSSFCSDDELKDRVVWVISCLMAASARHYMIGKVVKEHREMERVVITDAINQGSIFMNERQVEETRDRESESDEVLAERSRMPGVRMKLWYVPELEIEMGGGSVTILKGATLVVVRPKEGGGKKKWGSDRDFVKETFSKHEDEEDKVFGEAAMKMVKKKRNYTLEMNSF